MNQVKRERFQRVATRRTNQALKQIRVLARCANRNSYSFDSAEAEAICAALEREVRILRFRFLGIPEGLFQLPGPGESA